MQSSRQERESQRRKICMRRKTDSVTRPLNQELRNRLTAYLQYNIVLTPEIDHRVRLELQRQLQQHEKDYEFGT